MYRRMKILWCNQKLNWNLHIDRSKERAIQGNKINTPIIKIIKFMHKQMFYKILIKLLSQKSSRQKEQVFHVNQ